MAVGGGASAEFAKEYQQHCNFKKNRKKRDYSDIYKRDGLAQQIITVPVDDAISNWRDIEGDYAAIDSQLNVKKAVKQALIESRLNGTAIIYPVIRVVGTNRVVSPKRRLDLILNDQNQYEIAALQVFGGVSYSEELETNIASTRFGQPLMYQASNLQFHNSRVALFGDENCPYFESIVGYLADYHLARASKRKAVKRNNSFSLKADLTDLINHLKNKRAGDGEDLLEKVADLKGEILKRNLDECEIAVIGQVEEINQFQLNTIKDLISDVEQEQKTLSGLVRIPISRLFGIFTGGFSNSGLEAMENYAISLDNLINNSVIDPLMQVDQIIAAISGTAAPIFEFKQSAAELIVERLRGVPVS